MTTFCRLVSNTLHQQDHTILHHSRNKLATYLRVVPSRRSSFPLFAVTGLVSTKSTCCIITSLQLRKHQSNMVDTVTMTTDFLHVSRSTQHAGGYLCDGRGNGLLRRGMAAAPLKYLHLLTCSTAFQRGEVTGRRLYN